MENNYKYTGLILINEMESLSVVGGIDKGAQEALYLVGYVLGTACRYIYLFSIRFGKYVIQIGKKA
ncbi:MAG: hypothetical protein M0R23_02220 [Bacteroidales bacterium]|nr:hypothetical protein [Bacteroidales bacterium]